MTVTKNLDDKKMKQVIIYCSSFHAYVIRFDSGATLTKKLFVGKLDFG